LGRYSSGFQGTGTDKIGSLEAFSKGITIEDLIALICSYRKAGPILVKIDEVEGF
jgi:hypothetical protein